jgi:hypothetical protein
MLVFRYQSSRITLARERTSTAAARNADVNVRRCSAGIKSGTPGFSGA